MSGSDDSVGALVTPSGGAAASAVRAVTAVAFAVMWIGGAATYVAGEAPPERLSWTPPVFLGLSAATLLAWLPAGQRAPVAAAGLIGWLAEALGVHTGFPFGSYSYGKALGPGALGVPLAMAAAWGVFAAYAVALASRLVGGRALAPGAALWLVAVDLVVDPPASSLLGFWVWREGGAYFGVPLANFAGWFVVGVAACWALVRCRWDAASDRSGAALSMGLALVVFFTAICLARGMLVPGVVGVVLCGAHGTIVRSRKAATGRQR
ncbi:MAG: carotenoid biosynthesis protein [Chthonomonadales bacterium]|nr:carotenoid biosynthesis protein [Chthonomonadales bacterium]